MHPPLPPSPVSPHGHTLSTETGSLKKKRLGIYFTNEQESSMKGGNCHQGTAGAEDRNLRSGPKHLESLNQKQNLVLCTAHIVSSTFETKAITSITGK